MDVRSLALTALFCCTDPLHTLANVKCSSLQIHFGSFICSTNFFNSVLWLNQKKHLFPLLKTFTGLSVLLSFITQKYMILFLYNISYFLSVLVNFSIWSFGVPWTLFKTLEASHFPFHQSFFFPIIARRFFKTYCYSKENLSYAENKQLHRMSVQSLEWREVLDEYRHY